MPNLRGALRRESARREKLRRRALERFAEFVKQAWDVLHPGQTLYWSWHLDAICDHAEAVMRELLAARADPTYVMRWQKLLINVPPRSAKSMIVAVMLPAWLWLLDPTLKIRVVSGNPTLANKHSNFLRDLLDSSWYRGRFKVEWVVRGDIDAAGRFENTRRGEVRCHTIGAKVIGEGSDVTIIDDPHDSEEAKSEKKRAAVISRFDNVLSNRVVDPVRNAWIGIMQRLHESDWAGHVLAQGSGWEHLVIPLLLEKADPYCKCPSCTRGSTMIGWVDPRDVEGANILAERYSAQFIDGERKKGAYYFACQWQQRPAPAEGGMVKKAWLKYLDAEQMPAKFDRLVVSVDAATKEKDHERGSNTSMLLFGQKGPNKYALDNVTVNCDIDYALLVVRAWHKGLSVPPPHSLLEERRRELYALVCGKGVFAKPDDCEVPWWFGRGKIGATLVEDTVMGSSVCDVLQKDLPAVIRMKPRESGGHGAGDDKVSRLLAVQPEIMGGNLIILRGAPWLDTYVHELTVFPNGSKDDQVDATTQFLNWSRGSADLQSFLKWKK